MAKATKGEFELPKPHEKLPAKFIRDSLKKIRIDEIRERTVEILVETAKELAPRVCEPDEAADEHAPTIPDDMPTEAVLTRAEPAPEAVDTQETRAESADAKTSMEVTGEVLVPADKKYFRIGEAAELLGVEPYVLRYWESEFHGIRPMKSKSGHRTYSRKDVERFVEIRHLLYVEKFSVKGAKKRLHELRKQRKEAAVAAQTAGAPEASERHRERLKELIHELKGLVQVAKGNPGA